MKTSKIAIGAIIGAGVGIVAGMLTAPKSGRETRDEFLQKTNDVKNKALKKKDDMLFRAEELTESVKDKASEAIDNVKSKRK